MRTNVIELQTGKLASDNTGLVVSGADEQFITLCLALSFVAGDSGAANNQRLRKPRNR
jgi:hypothetical protein